MKNELPDYHVKLIADMRKINEEAADFMDEQAILAEDGQSTCNYDRFSDKLLSAFDWSLAKQGTNFWVNIFRILEKEKADGRETSE